MFRLLQPQTRSAHHKLGSSPRASGSSLLGKKSVYFIVGQCYTLSFTYNHNVYLRADVAERTNFVSGSIQKRYPSFQQALHAYTVKYNERSVHAVPIPGGPFWPMNSPVSPASPPPPASPTLSIDSDDLWSQVEDLSDTMSQYKFEST